MWIFVKSYVPICFYSTYEELKLAMPKYTDLPYLSFLQYLWGIETWAAEDFSDDTGSAFLQYLWGIET